MWRPTNSGGDIPRNDDSTITVHHKNDNDIIPISNTIKLNPDMCDYIDVAYSTTSFKEILHKLAVGNFKNV